MNSHELQKGKFLFFTPTTNFISRIKEQYFQDKETRKILVVRLASYTIGIISLLFGIIFALYFPTSSDISLQSKFCIFFLIFALGVCYTIVSIVGWKDKE